MLEQELLEAVRQKSKTKINKLIKQGIDLNAQNEIGQTPLMLALEMVLSARIDHWYSEGHNGDRFVQYKLNNGLFTYHVNKEERSFPLKDQKYCAKQSWGPQGQMDYYNAIDSALAILKGASQLDRQDDNGDTALIIAARIGEPRLLKALLKGGADPTISNKKGEVALHAIATSGRLDGLKFFFKQIEGLDVHTKDGAGWTVLHHLVATQDHLAMFKFFEEQGVDFKQASTAEKLGYPKGTTALEIAKDKSRTQIVPFLDVEKTTFTIAEIREAALSNRLSIVEKYLQKGGDPAMQDDQHKTSILLSVARNDRGEEHTADMVALLLKYGADVNAVQGSNFNALMLCINSLYNKGPRILAFDNEYMEHVKIAKILIENNVNLAQAKSGSNQKALRDACEISPEITTMIVDKLIADYPNYKQEFDHQDSDGFTALHVGARSGNVDVLKLLIEKGGASINLPEDYGFIPLHEAIIAGKYDASKYLIEQGADVQHKISRGYSAYRSGDDAKAIASKSSNKKILNLF
ncbi:ankyrin repeat domain-containing protein [Aureispira sp. CCB-E]|uniref:ankyrin repeat domain-containing protein n=1 Tax=Aureispira sp. CCB-E TaxID=3051121 RepID=UPI0028686E09|nr:ankyrin repeat domain-containing protein [Aureispira sp. CCB-E]WMX15172.1 ankyrin repeat domain-containing protein [Aureispira sp. CCB-E]